LEHLENLIYRNFPIQKVKLLAFFKLKYSQNFSALNFLCGMPTLNPKKLTVAEKALSLINFPAYFYYSNLFEKERCEVQNIVLNGKDDYRPNLCPAI
jgi:hypothetical protein